MLGNHKGGDMKKNRANIKELGFNLDEKSKQKVTRSTFRFDQEVHQIIAYLCELLGVKNADLFEKMSNLIESKKLGEPISFEKADKGTRKTYVVKKGTLDKLGKMAKERKERRDSLIENTVRQLMQIIKEGQADKRERYKKVHENIIKPFLDRSEKISATLIAEFDNDDPMVRRFRTVVTILTVLDTAIEHFLKDGTPIDPEDTSQQ